MQVRAGGLEPLGLGTVACPNLFASCGGQGKQMLGLCLPCAGPVSSLGASPKWGRGAEGRCNT